MDSPGEPMDPRAHRRREQRRLLWVAVAFPVVVGTAVIALVYGLPAAGTGLICLLTGAGTIVLLWLVLKVIERLGRTG
jgi:multisubunit Na+/H+ antiporter MnhB subunit